MGRQIKDRECRKNKRKKIRLRRLIFALVILLIILFLLLRKEWIDGINGESVQEFQQKVEKLLFSKESESETVETVSKYEYKTPQKLDSAQIEEELFDLASKYSEFQEIYDNYDSYPQDLLNALCNNPDMIDFVKGYNNADRSVSGSLTKEDFERDIPSLIQWDKRWGYISYGDDNIALSGCAPTCLSMVIAGLNHNSDVTPETVAKYAMDNNYYLQGTGTKWSIMTEGCLKFGIKGTVIQLNEEKIMSELEMGHPIICSMRPGDFTTGGHFIVLAGVKNEKIVVNDPNSKVRSNMLWDYAVLESQIKNLWVFEKFK